MSGAPRHGDGRATTHGHQNSCARSSPLSVAYLAARSDGLRLRGRAAAAAPRVRPVARRGRARRRLCRLGSWRFSARTPCARIIASRCHVTQVPANPICWSLTLLHPASVSAFGCGYFDDAGDVPGEPVLMYTLRGEWTPAERAGGADVAAAEGDGGAVSFLKEYTSPALFGDAPVVRYEGRLVRGRGATGACVRARALTWRTRE